MYSSKINLHFVTFLLLHLSKKTPHLPISPKTLNLSNIPHSTFPQSPKFTIPQIHFATIPPNHPNSQLLQIHFATIPQIHFLPQFHNSSKYTLQQLLQIHQITQIPQIHLAPSHSLRLRPSPLCRPCGARWSVNIIMIMKRMMTMAMLMTMVMMMPHKLLSNHPFQKLKLGHTGPLKVSTVTFPLPITKPVLCITHKTYSYSECQSLYCSPSLRPSSTSLPRWSVTPRHPIKVSSPLSRNSLSNAMKSPYYNSFSAPLVHAAPVAHHAVHHAGKMKRKKIITYCCATYTIHHAGMNKISRYFQGLQL